jgi:hypothetical protein
MCSSSSLNSLVDIFGTIKITSSKQKVAIRKCSGFDRKQGILSCLVFSVHVINFVTSSVEKNRRWGFSEDVFCLGRVPVCHSPYLDLSRLFNNQQHEHELGLILKYYEGLKLAFKLCLLKRNKRGNMSTY